MALRPQVELGFRANDLINGTNQAKRSLSDFQKTASGAMVDLQSRTGQAETAMTRLSSTTQRVSVDVKGLALSMVGLGTTTIGVITSLSNLDRAALRVEKAEIAIQRIEDQISSTRLRLIKLTEQGKQGTEDYRVQQERLSTALADLRVKEEDLKVQQDALNDTYVLFATTVVNTTINSIFLARSAFQGLTLAQIKAAISTRLMGTTAATTGPAVAGLGGAATGAAGGFTALGVALKSIVSDPRIAGVLLAIGAAVAAWEIDLFGLRTQVGRFVGTELPSMTSMIEQATTGTKELAEETMSAADAALLAAEATSEQTDELKELLDLVRGGDQHPMVKFWAAVRLEQLGALNTLKEFKKEAGGVLSPQAVANIQRTTGQGPSGAPVGVGGGGQKIVGSPSGVGTSTGVSGVAGGGVVTTAPSGGVSVAQPQASATVRPPNIANTAIGGTPNQPAGIPAEIVGGKITAPSTQQSLLQLKSTGLFAQGQFSPGALASVARNRQLFGGIQQFDFNLTEQQITEAGGPVLATISAAIRAGILPQGSIARARLNPAFASRIASILGFSPSIVLEALGHTITPAEINTGIFGEGFGALAQAIGPQQRRVTAEDQLARGDFLSKIIAPILGISPTSNRARIIDLFGTTAADIGNVADSVPLNEAIRLANLQLSLTPEFSGAGFDLTSNQGRHLQSLRIAETLRNQGFPGVTIGDILKFSPSDAGKFFGVGGVNTGRGAFAGVSATAAFQVESVGGFTVTLANRLARRRDSFRRSPEGIRTLIFTGALGGRSIGILSRSQANLRKRKPGLFRLPGFLEGIGRLREIPGVAEAILDMVGPFGEGLDAAMNIAQQVISQINTILRPTGFTAATLPSSESLERGFLAASLGGFSELEESEARINFFKKHEKPLKLTTEDITALLQDPSKAKRDLFLRELNDKLAFLNMEEYATVGTGV